MFARNTALDVGGADEPVIEGKEWVLSRKADIAAIGICTRKLDGSTRHSRAVFGELDHLCARDEIDYLLGRLKLNERRTREIDSVLHLTQCRRIDALVGVTDGDRAQTHPVVEVSPTVRIPHIGALAASKDRWRDRRKLIVAARIGMRTSRNQRMQPLAVIR